MTTMTIQLPDEFSKALGDDPQAASRQALEAVAVDLFRRKKLTHYQLSTALGLDRFATDGLLKDHNVLIEMTSSELAEEMADLHTLLKR